MKSPPFATPPPCQSTEENYFDVGTFIPPPVGFYASWTDDRRRRYDARVSQWFTTTLRFMGAARLGCGEHAGTTYRLLCIPSWTPPLMVEVHADAGYAELGAAELAGNFGPEWERLACRVHRRLTTAEQQLLISAIHDSSFWLLPSMGSAAVLDGTALILEGRTPSHYRAVHREKWGDTPSFERLAELFLSLAGYRPIPPNEI